MKLLSAARDLKRRKARERNDLFVVEGVRATEELLRSNIARRGALVTAALERSERGKRLVEQLKGTATEVAEIDERDLASAANTDSPQGVLVIAEVPRREVADVVVSDRMRLLLLDGVQDPGNVGTMLRTASAFGVSATIALPGTVDLWSAKVVRSAMGAQFNHLALHASLSQVMSFLGRHDVVLWGSEAGASPVDDAGPLPARMALAVGNEGAGLSDDVRANVTRSVGIPTTPNVDSLNVSVAAGILLFQLSR